MIALPEGFRQRMERLLGAEYPAFLASYDRKRRPALRINTLKADPADIRRHLPYLEEQVPWAPEAYYYSAADAEGRENRPGKSPLHEAGCYYIQEPTAMAVAALTGTVPGERILDLCAAPGGKSTQLACMLKGRGILVSNEISADRAKILSRNIERCGIRNAVVTNEDSAALATRFPAFFDRIVVDAPCSGEGMFRKEQAALDMWSEENIRHCHVRQMEILENAARMLRWGGTLIYSTCTFAPEEDEESVAAFLDAFPDFHVKDLPAALGERMAQWGFETGRPSWCSLNLPQEIKEELRGTIRLFPHRLEGEGHFLAVLTKGEETPSAGRERNRTGAGKKAKERRKPDPAAGIREAYLQFERDTLRGSVLQTEDEKREGGEALPSAACAAFGEELYLVPSGISCAGLKVLRPGLDLGTRKKDRFEPAHALALAMRAEEAERTVDFAAGSQEAAAWLRGESVPCSTDLRGWVLVTFDGYTAGWGKAAGGVLKNHYPRGLRRPY